MSMKRLDASLIGALNCNAPGVTGVPNFVDSNPALPDETWLVDSCFAYVLDPNSAASIAANIVASGIFICPPGTPQVPLAAGTIRLALSSDDFNDLMQESNGGQKNAGACTLKEFIVPPGWFLRFCFSPVNGATPAAGSSVNLSFTYVRRKVDSCYAEPVCVK